MSATATTLPILDVHVEPGLNARRQEQESELEALRDSVARHGVLQPLLVRPREEGGVWLVAGHRRLAAAQLAELPEVPVVQVTGERLELTAVENLQRAQLSPLEEARAFKSLSDAGHSRKGIAQALSVAPRRVTERLTILEFTDAGQQAVGDGSLPLSAVSVLVELTQVSGQLADRVLAFALVQHDPGALVRDPGWMVARAVGVELSEAAELGWLPTHRRIPLAVLGIEDYALVAKAEAIAASSYDRAGVRLTEEDLARAIAGRCGWADERGTGVISRDWLAEQAPELVEAEWQEREAEQAQRTAARQTGKTHPKTTVKESK
jgi:ParB/RepB/Spo0J family partition protein